jgi:hypothetical protein
MLSAILHGKGRRLPEGVGPADSLRKVFVRSEDMLTSTVFERLSYLDGPTLWAVLAATFRPTPLPERNVVELLDLEFWPTWGQARDTLGKSVEPDVVIRLSAGDPPTTWTLIVECKFGGGLQDPGQWMNEWIACLAERENAEQPGETVLLALGGVHYDGPERMVERLAGTAKATRGLALQVAAADWTDLLWSIGQVDAPGSVARRIFEDIRSALDLHGYRRTLPLSDLSTIRMRHALGEGSAEALCWAQEPPAAARADPPRDGAECLADWPERTGAFRPIRFRPELKWESDLA